MARFGGRSSARPTLDEPAGLKKRLTQPCTTGCGRVQASGEQVPHARVPPDELVGQAGQENPPQRAPLAVCGAHKPLKDRLPHDCQDDLGSRHTGCRPARTVDHAHLAKKSWRLDLSNGALLSFQIALENRDAPAKQEVELKAHVTLATDHPTPLNHAHRTALQNAHEVIHCDVDIWVGFQEPIGLEPVDGGAAGGRHWLPPKSSASTTLEGAAESPGASNSRQAS